MSSTIAQEELRRLYAQKFVIERWPQPPKIEPQFKDAESSFIVGATHSGKSRLLMRLVNRFQQKTLGLAAKRRTKIIDAFGAENDSESCVHLLDPKNRDTTAVIVGNEVIVEGLDNVIPVADFSLDKIDDYSCIVTDRALFGPYDDEKWDYKYYAALARLFQLLKRRSDPSCLLVLCVREVWNLVYSVIKAGISPDEQKAQGEFRKMHNQRYHSRVGVVMDTQRYTDLAASVRTLVDYRYVKGFGAQPLPNELKFLYKPHLFGSIPGRYHNPREWMVRNCPVDQFILITRRNGVATGWFGDIPWHIEKGFSPLKKLGVTVTLKQREDDEERKANDERQGVQYLPPVNEQHRRMLELKKEGYGHKAIAQKFTDEGVLMTWQKVAYHLRKQCTCEVTTTQIAS